MTTTDPTSSPATESPAAGWYPDPDAPNGRTERWWNGLAWSEHRRRGPSPTPPTIEPSAFAAPPRRRGRSAYWSLGLGIFALAIALTALLSRSHGFWLSTTGVVAVIWGVRALRARALGQGTPFVPAVLGIVFGGLGTMLMLAMLLLNLTFRTFAVSSPRDVVNGSSAQNGASANDGSATGGVAAPAPTGSAGSTAQQLLQAWAPSKLPDDALSTYGSVEVKSVTSVAAGCGVLNAEPQAMPLDPGYERTPQRERQDYLRLQAQGMSQQLLNQVSTSKVWPTSIDVAPDTRVVFTPAPACTPLGVMPKGIAVEYALGPDHGQSSFALWDSTLRVGVLWRSVDNTVYWL